MTSGGGRPLPSTSESLQSGDFLLPLAALTAGVGLSALLLSWFQLYHVGPVVLVGVLGALYFRKQARIPSPWVLGLMLLLVGVHLFFRLPTYPHYEGGQDQGVYFNWSRVISAEGGNRLCDSLPERLETAELELYDANGGFALPGLSADPGGSDCYRMAFYPLPPIWLAVAGDLFGFDHRGLALTFFSLLLLAASCRLVGELTRFDPTAIGWIALLVAVNPGLVFLSRFPLSEISAAATVALSLALLTTAWRRAGRGQAFSAHLILSVASFACYVFTRASFLHLAPFLLALVFGIQLFVHRTKKRRPFLMALIAYGGLSILAVGYYTVTIPHRFGLRLGRLLDRHSLWILLGLLLLGAAFFAAGRYRSSSLVRRARREIARWHRPALVGALLLAVVFHLLDVSLRLIAQPVLLAIYETPAGFLGLSRAQIFRTCVYLTPLGVLILVAGLIAARPREPRERLLVFGPLVSILYMLGTLGLTWSPYSYYYDRFILGELVPFALVALVVTTTWTWSRSPDLRLWARYGLLVVALWSLLGTLVLRKAVEGSPPEAFDGIAEVVGPESLLLLDRSSIRHTEALLTGLRVEKRLQVFPLRNLETLSDPSLHQLRSRSESTFVLTGLPEIDRPDLRQVADVARVRSFFSDESRHMLDLLTASAPPAAKRHRAPAYPWLQRWLPPLHHTEVRETLLVYESLPVACLPLLSLEAEALPTTLLSPEAVNVAEPLTHGGNGLARTALPRYLPDAGIGAMAFGPYRSQKAGDYLVRFWFRGNLPEAARLGIDAASSRGSQVHARRRVQPSELSLETYSGVELRLSLADSVEDLEFRVWYSGGTLWLDRIDLLLAPADCQSPTRSPSASRPLGGPSEAGVIGEAPDRSRHLVLPGEVLSP